MKEIAYFSTGLKRLEDEIRHISKMEPRFRVVGAKGAAAVAGWGHKQSADRARRLARVREIPYLALEDGLLRSLRPGPAQRPISMVADWAGVYYDANSPCDLETILATEVFSEGELSRAEALIAQIAVHRLSKYNHGLERPLNELKRARKVVLLIDQTFGDASVAGSLSDASTFHRMIEAARAENPDAMIVARLHPETMIGAKPGYLAGLAKDPGITVFSEPVSPWCFLDLLPHVYTVSSQFGFEALMAGCQVTCFGVPFYSGWGLTDDRGVVPTRRGRKRSRLEIAAALYLRYTHYFDCWRREPVSAETAVDQLAFLRKSYIANDAPVIGYRIARWKRRAVKAMLDSPHGEPRFTSSLSDAIAAAKETGARIAAWGIDALRIRPQLEKEGISCIAIEDGFLRSVGLGAAFTEPLSLVFDRTGLYIDPEKPSDLEAILLQSNDLGTEAERAATIRQRIIQEKITKYNVESLDGLPPIPTGAETDVILVPGQVQDDWAVRIGRPESFPEGENINALLLQRVRKANPSAFVIYKPHPDVEKMGRLGRLSATESANADAIAHNVSMADLLSICSRVETYSSLAGFEALLRGLKVTVHGRPFYAGWGLTTDHASFERRNRPRTLDELVTAALLRYPLYWDPKSRLACPPEVVLDRMTTADRRSLWTRRPGRELLGRVVIVIRRIAGALKNNRGE